MGNSTIEALLGALATIIAAGAAGYFTMKQSRSNNTAAPYEKLAERVAALETEATERSRQVASLERKVNGWLYWYDDLTLRWAVHRARETPPPSPLSLVDPHFHD